MKIVLPDREQRLIDTLIGLHYLSVHLNDAIGLEVSPVVVFLSLSGCGAMVAH